MADVFTISAQSRDELEKIVVELLELASRCVSTDIEHGLMRLADGLVKIIDEIKESNAN